MKIKSTNPIINFIALFVAISILYYLIITLYGIVLQIKPDSLWYKEGFLCAWFICSIIGIRLDYRILK